MWLKFFSASRQPAPLPSSLEIRALLPPMTSKILADLPNPLHSLTYFSTVISEHSGLLVLRDCAVLSCSVVSDSATPWTVACQAPLSMGFSRQQFWNELPCPLLYRLSHQGSPSLSDSSLELLQFPACFVFSRASEHLLTLVPLPETLSIFLLLIHECPLRQLRITRETLHDPQVGMCAPSVLCVHPASLFFISI